jgi:hypothetical protein
MGLVGAGIWTNRPLGFPGKDFARNPVSNARNFNNGGFVSVPVGYYHNALIMPLKIGGIACTFKSGSTLEATEIIGSSDLACNMNGSSTFTAVGALGRNLECTIEGNGGLTAVIEAKGLISCVIQIGANPSAVDIAQAVLNALAAQYNIPGTIGAAIQTSSGTGGGSLTTEEHDQLMKTLTKSTFIALK